MKNNTTVFSTFKGMNRQADIVNMPSNYLYDIYNMYLSRQNAISSRFGYSKKYSAQVDGGADITNCFEAVYDDESKDFFVTTATKIFRWDSSGSTWSSIKTGLSSTSYTDIIQYGDVVVFSNGVNTPQKFAKGGSATSNLTMPSGVTSFRIMHICQNRLWGVDAADNYKVFYSSLGNIEDYTTTGDAGYGYLDLQAYVSKGDRVEAIGTFSKSYLVFFMGDHTIAYSLGTYGTVASEFSLAQVNNGTGAKSRDSILTFGKDLYYLDNDTPKSFQSSLASEELDINDFTKGVFGDYYREAIQGLSSDRLCIEKYHRKSWIVINLPIGTSSDILIWDYTYQVWSGRWRLTDKVNRLMQNSVGELLFTSEGYIYKFDEDVFQDDGENYSFHLMPPFYWSSNPAAYERYEKIEFLAESGSTGAKLAVSGFYGLDGSVSFFEEVDIGVLASFWDVALWDVAEWDASGQDVYSIACLGRGQLMRIVFSNSQGNKNITIKMWQLFPLLEASI